ncbi:MAG: hypothetical protein GY757_23925, partial [bacterium]|nr:hypothetical protein [bacterium]
MKKILKKYNAWCFVASIAMCLLLTFCSVGGESSETAETPETTPTPTDVILFAPQGLTTTYLIDKSGGVVNTWESNNQPGLSVYLLEDKSLLRTASPGNNSTFGNTGGAGGRGERFDWDGNQVWEFDYSSDTYLLHHDIEYLPSGNILMIAWEYKSREEAVAAGRNPTLLSEGELWPDKLIEVEPTGSSGGTIVWEWRIWDHLIQEYDESKPNYGT